MMISFIKGKKLSKPTWPYVKNELPPPIKSWKKHISESLGRQQTSVRAIIDKWRKLATVVNLPRSAYQNYFKSATTTHPGGHKRTQNNI